MNKQDLVEALSARLQKSQREASETIDALVDEIKKALVKGEAIRISGFGAFEQTVRGARQGRNPRTGEPVKINPTRVVRFRPAADFKAIVAGTRRAVAAAVPGIDAKPDEAAEQAPASAPRRATAKKTTAKKTTAKKAPAKKAPAKKATAATPAVKTTATKKAAVARKAAAPTTTAAKKAAAPTTAAAKKATATKAAARKTAVKKTAAPRGTAVGRTAAKKAVAGKAAAKTVAQPTEATVATPES